MKALQLLYRFAYPVAQSKYDQNKISKEVFLQLKRGAFQGKDLSEDLITKHFKNAYGALRVAAFKADDKNNVFDLERIIRYVTDGHSKLIDGNQGCGAKKSDKEKVFCRVNPGLVRRISESEIVKGEKIYFVETDHGEIPALNIFNYEINKDDKVYIHRGYIFVTECALQQN